MKEFLVLVLAAAISACMAEGVVDFSEIPPLTLETQAKLGRIFTLSLLKYLEDAKVVQYGEARIPILPGFENDVIHLDSFWLDFSPESGISDWLHGEVDFCNVTLSGLKSLINDLQLAFDLPGASASLKLALGDLQLDARQETNVTLFQNHSLIASEDFFLRLQDISIQISFDIANIWPWIKLDISKVEFRIDVSAFKFEVYSDNAAWNGEPIDFDRLNKLITVISKVVLLSLEPLIEDFLAVNVPVWFQECTIWQLAVKGDFSCIGAQPEEGKVVGLNQLLMSEISEFVSISESTICPAEDDGPADGGSSSAGTTIDGDEPGSTEETSTEDNTGTGNLAAPLILAIALLSLFHF